MKETKFYIQKAICFLLTFCIVVATLLQNAYALSNSVTTEILLPSETSLDKGTQRKTTENELPSLTQCTA